MGSGCERWPGRRAGGASQRVTTPARFTCGTCRNSPSLWNSDTASSTVCGQWRGRRTGGNWRRGTPTARSGSGVWAKTTSRYRSGAIATMCTTWPGRRMDRRLRASGTTVFCRFGAAPPTTGIIPGSVARSRLTEHSAASGGIPTVNCLPLPAPMASTCLKSPSSCRGQVRSNDEGESQCPEADPNLVSSSTGPVSPGSSMSTLPCLATALHVLSFSKSPVRVVSASPAFLSKRGAASPPCPTLRYWCGSSSMTRSR